MKNNYRYNFSDLSEFSKYVSANGYQRNDIRYDYSAGGEYFLLREPNGWRVLVKEPGRSEVYYDECFSEISMAGRRLLEIIDGIFSI